MNCQQSNCRQYKPVFLDRSFKGDREKDGKITGFYRGLSGWMHDVRFSANSAQCVKNIEILHSRTQQNILLHMMVNLAFLPVHFNYFKW